jgi:hypothetical protein
MTRPTILIYVTNPNLNLLKEVCAGMEEEGVSYEVVPKENNDIDNISYESANASILGTGIGMCGSILVLTLNSLPKGKHVFKIEEPSLSQARLLGTNAGRAVKRNAFKEIG